MRAIVLLMLWLAGPALPPRPVAERPGVTPFEPGQGDDIVLAAKLNGRGPFRLLLDTGSTHTAVSARTAEAIAAPVVARTAVGSAAGSRDALVVRIDTLEVGPVSAPGLLASVVDPGPIAPDIDGVIGHDALAPLRYTIDFRRRAVVWWPAEVRGDALELQASQGRFLLSLPQRGSVLRLVPDSGASSLLLFDPDRALPVAHLPGGATLGTAAAEIDVRLARVRELRIGGATLRDVPAVVAERDRSEPADVDGLLPLHLFDRVTVDGPGQRILVEHPRH